MKFNMTSAFPIAAALVAVVAGASFADDAVGIMRIDAGTNYILQDYNFDNQNDELYFYSGRIEKLGDGFKKKAKRLADSDLRRIVGDNGVFKVSSVFFLSESIAAVAPSSAEGRNTFVGRGYLLLYDFRTDKIFWRRKSDSELFHWNQRVSVLMDDAALSADERHLAVSTGGVIYIYKDFVIGREL